ncbi:hypothetical protein C0995_009122, partial [Termitomyces sp. Mi166
NELFGQVFSYRSTTEKANPKYKVAWKGHLKLLKQVKANNYHQHSLKSTLKKITEAE